MGNQGFGGTFFRQNANNEQYFSSNGHTINIQGPTGANIHVSVDRDGQAYYYSNDAEEDLLDEFPQDPEEGFSDSEQYYQEDENVDSDGDPIPSADEVKNIINSINVTFDS